MKMNTKFLTRAGIIAALYAGLTLFLAMIPGINSLSFGPVQFRLAEALTVLPYFTSAAIPGLSVGCLIANALSPYPLDMLFGTVATLLAAICTRLISKWKWRYAYLLAPLPPVIFNALIIGWELSLFAGTPFWYNVVTVGLGQLTVCYILGLPVMQFTKRVLPSL